MRTWSLFKRSSAVALTLAAAVAAGCGGDDSDGGGGSGSGFELTIGNVTPMTGSGSVFGPAYNKAADLAVQQVQEALEKAGADNVEVSVEHADGGSVPDKAVSAARKVVGGGASCLVGSIFSGDTEAIARSATGPSGAVQISPSSSATHLTDLEDNGLLFRVALPDSVQGPVLARAMVDAIGEGKSVAIGARNDIFGKGFVEEFKPAWSEAGGTVASEVLVDQNAASYESEAAELARSNPDSYMFVMFAPDYGKLGGALLRTGKFSTDTVFLGGGQPETIPDFIPKAALEGARGIRPALPVGTDAALEFDELFKRESGTKARQTLDGNNFDATMLCSLAALSAGSSDGRDIAENLQKVSGPPGPKYTWLELDKAVADLRAGKDIDYEGVSGSIDLDDKGDPTAGAFDWFEYVDSKLTVLQQYLWNDGELETVEVDKGS